MPYRLNTGAAIAPIEVLLVTSRRTGRWVVPKGNPMKGLSRHAAAAQEALEEAGVEGKICATPLGIYRVLKQLPLGSMVWLDVELFPLAVAVQHDSWLEEGQRYRRWFTLPAAAEAVYEQDLSDLIRSFAVPTPH